MTTAIRSRSKASSAVLTTPKKAAGTCSMPSEKTSDAGPTREQSGVATSTSALVSGATAESVRYVHSSRSAAHSPFSP
eukprot:377326-Prymnesium_polylepis.2